MKGETAKKLGKWMDFKAFQQLDEVSNKLGQLYQTKKVFPEAKNIFRAFELTPPDKVKVVVLFQDPYFNEYKSRRDGSTKCYATGIALGNFPDVDKRSPSLEIFIQGIVKNNNGICLDDSLEPYCKQGVLMLNSALTVEKGQPNSHALLWEPFTKSLLKELSERMIGGIYILIGSRAGKFYDCLNPFTSNIYTCEHPSMALHEGRPWRDEQVFKQANAALYKISQEQINW